MGWTLLSCTMRSLHLENNKWKLIALRPIRKYVKLRRALFRLYGLCNDLTGDILSQFHTFLQVRPSIGRIFDGNYNLISYITVKSGKIYVVTPLLFIENILEKQLKTMSILKNKAYHYNIALSIKNDKGNQKGKTCIANFYLLFVLIDIDKWRQIHTHTLLKVTLRVSILRKCCEKAIFTMHKNITIFIGKLWVHLITLAPCYYLIIIH